MYQETIKGKPERVGKIPVPPIKETQELMSSANRAIEDYTARPTQVRHPLGHGIPKTSELLGGE
jgi:hypothetical protein